MNQITVNACGMEGSPARRVQHDPQLAINLFISLKWLLREYQSGNVHEGTIRQAQAALLDFDPDLADWQPD